MKTKVAVYTGVIWLSSALVLATPFFSVAAQSGGDSQTPVSAVAQTRPQATPGDVKTGTAAAPGADEYRLVFPEGYAASNTKEAGDTHRASKFETFIERLNEAGASYEYQWLYADGGRSDSREVTIGFDDKYNGAQPDAHPGPQ